MANKGEFLIGSICLSDIDKSLIKAVETKKGKKLYLNISVGEICNKDTGEPEPTQYGDTHYISCAPKKELRVEGRYYNIGNLKKWEEKQEAAAPTPEEINNAPTIDQAMADDLPF